MSVFQNKIADVITQILVTVLAAGIVAAISAAIATAKHTDAISALNKQVGSLQGDVNELKLKSASVDVKISSQEESIRRLQNDMDSIKYKLATIPDRSELNESFNLFYERLASKIERSK